MSDLRARRCSWAWRVERVYGSSCWPVHCCTWVSPPGGESPPEAGARSLAAWPCLRSPPGSRRALYGCQWGTKDKHTHIYGMKSFAQWAIELIICLLCLKLDLFFNLFMLRHHSSLNSSGNHQPLLSAIAVLQEKR